MRVIVFDVDGTLTRTNEVDDRLYSAAVRAVLDVPFDGSFNDFEEVTDSGILRALHMAHSSRPYETVEAEVLSHFLSALSDAAEREPDSFRPIEGAAGVFAAVREAGWVPAIATGGWRESAELKLGQAEIPSQGVPLATSSETPRRVEIIRRAVSLAVEHQDESTDIVYVGDGSWDVRACRELSIGFIGRTDLGSGADLTALGARATIPDFKNANELLDLLSDPRSLVPTEVAA